MSRINKNLMHYLKDPDLYESFSLGRSGQIFFHWANSKEYLRNLRSDSTTKRRLREKITIIKKALESEPAWLISKQNQIESNIYELYKYFLDPRLRELWFEVNDDITLSLRTVQGPYTRLQSMRWFDFEIYRAFVFEKLLRCQTMRLREFRLNSKIDIEIIPMGMPYQNIRAEVSQVMEDGILLTIRSKSEMQKVTSAKNIQFRLDLNPLKKEISYDSYVKGSQDFFLNDDILDLGNNRENCSYSNGKEYHLYIGFDEIDKSIAHEIKAPFSELLNKYKAIIDNHIERLSEKENYKEKVSA